MSKPEEQIIRRPLSWTMRMRYDALTALRERRPQAFVAAEGLSFLVGGAGIIEVRGRFVGEDYDFTQLTPGGLSVAVAGKKLVTAPEVDPLGRGGLEPRMNLLVEPGVIASIGTSGLHMATVVPDQEIADLRGQGVRFFDMEVLRQMDRDAI